MSIISDLMTGGIGSIVETVGKVAGDLITTDKERFAAENENKRLGLEETKAFLADTDSARKMQMAALAQEDLFSKRFIYWFAMVWSLFAMIFMAVVALCDIPPANTRAVDTILGFLLGTAIAGIFNFFLGTTYRSQKKDDTIQAMASK